jgi:hypothetical protein
LTLLNDLKVWRQPGKASENLRQAERVTVFFAPLKLARARSEPLGIAK